MACCCFSPVSITSSLLPNERALYNKLQVVSQNKVLPSITTSLA